MNNKDEITKESLSQKEKVEESFDIGEKEADVYTKEGLSHLQEDEDELSPEEAGFMQGELNGGKNAKCATCGKVLEDEVFERNVKGEVYKFCSEECDKKFQVQDTKQ